MVCFESLTKVGPTPMKSGLDRAERPPEHLRDRTLVEIEVVTQGKGSPLPRRLRLHCLRESSVGFISECLRLGVGLITRSRDQ